MPAFDSRTAPKFVVRFDNDTTRQLVSDRADLEHISMNSFVLQAIDEKLERGARIDRLLDAAEKNL